MGGCIAGCAHPSEKSAPSFMNTSIHRLPIGRLIFVSSALPRSENEARNVVVTGLYLSAFVPNCDRKCERS
jgi:hypothetical protein